MFVANAHHHDGMADFRVTWDIIISLHERPLYAWEDNVCHMVVAFLYVGQEIHEQLINI